MAVRHTPSPPHPREKRRGITDSGSKVTAGPKESVSQQDDGRAWEKRQPRNFSGSLRHSLAVDDRPAVVSPRARGEFREP